MEELIWVVLLVTMDFTKMARLWHLNAIK